MKAADLRLLAVSLHLDDGQSLETAAQNTRMSRRSLTMLLSYVPETGDVHYAPEKWKTHAENILRCPDLRSAVLFAVEQFPEAFLDENSDFVTHLHQLLGDDFSLSPSSVSRVLAAHGFTRKVIESAFTSRNELALREMGPTPMGHPFPGARVHRQDPPLWSVRRPQVGLVPSWVALRVLPFQRSGSEHEFFSFP